MIQFSRDPYRGDTAHRPQQFHDILLARIQSDPDYQRCLDYGKPRPGHPEGTVRAHIGELERNLEIAAEIRSRLGSPLSDEQLGRLRVLIHTHDTFKADAERGVPIEDPRSHASRAAHFLKQHGADEGLCAVAQWHDVPYSIWRKKDEAKQQIRVESLKDKIPNLEEFCLFQIVDNITVGKDSRPVAWFIRQMRDELSEHVKIEAVLRELQMAIKPTDTGSRLAEAIYGDFVSDSSACLRDQREREALKSFARHLSDYCRLEIPGIAQQVQLELPEEWESMLARVVKLAGPKVPPDLTVTESQSLETQWTLVDNSRVDPAKFDLRQTGLIRLALAAEPNCEQVLLAYVSYICQAVSAEERNTLGKLCIALGRSADDLRLCDNERSVALFAVGGALTRHVEDSSTLA